MYRIKVTRLRGPRGRGRVELSDVRSYEILSDMIRLADGFTMGLPGPVLDEEATVASGDELQFTIGGRVLFAGIVDAIWDVISPEGKGTKVVGRDYGKDLVDQAMPLRHENQVSAIALAKMVSSGTRIRSVVTQGVTYQGFPPADDLVQKVRFPDPETRVVDSIRVHTEPGETRANFLSRYLTYMDYLAWVDTRGRLVIGLPLKTPPLGVIRVQKGMSNAEATVYEAAELAVREVQVLQSSEEDLPESFPVERAIARSRDYRLQDTGIVRVIPSPDLLNNAEAQLMADRELARGSAALQKIEISIPGHQIGDTILRPDQTWRIVIPERGIDSELYCRSVRYMQSDPQRRTTRALFIRHDAVVSRFAGGYRDKDDFDLGEELPE